MLSLGHGNFRLLLNSKAKTRHTTICASNESFTTKICGNCRFYHRTLGAAEIFNYPNCQVVEMRDGGSSRKILLKEVFNAKGFRDSCEKELLHTVVFDEVHCLVTWGRTFRTAYLLARIFRISPAGAILKKLVFLCLSGTVTTPVLREIKSILNLSDDFILLQGELNHPNHYYDFDPFVSNEKDVYPLIRGTLAVPAFRALNNPEPRMSLSLPNQNY